jgi:hypothetical protein
MTSLTQLGVLLVQHLVHMQQGLVLTTQQSDLLRGAQHVEQKIRIGFQFVVKIRLTDRSGGEEAEGGGP